MSTEMSPAEARAQEVVERFEEALDRQFGAAAVRSWADAPKHIREAHGDLDLTDPPSREAMDAWTAWLDLRTNSLRRCRENLEKGRAAARDDPARAEIHWKRATSTAERGLAELPVLVGVRISRIRAAEKSTADPAPYNASAAWTVAAYGASGLGTLIVLGVGAFLLGESVGAIVSVQGVLLAIGFLPALEVMHRVLGTLARRAADAGKAPGSTDTAAVVLPFVFPICIAVVSWLIVTSQ